MTYCGSWKIDDLLTFFCNTQVFATGVATDADSAPAYRVYEDETTTPILTGTMALLDSANTAGFYSEQITLSAANGFEKGKCYSIYIAATVSSVAGATHRTFQIEAEVDANRLNWANVDGATTANALTNTTIATTQKVDIETIKTNPVVNGGTITFPTTATLASTTNITAGTITTATNLTNAPTAGDFTAVMKTSLNAATPAVTVSDKTGFALTSAYDFAKGTVAMTESYAANGVAPTPAQALFAIQQHLTDFAITGTSYTVFKLDHVTTAYIGTLDNAATPTSQLRL